MTEINGMESAMTDIPTLQATVKAGREESEALRESLRTERQKNSAAWNQLGEFLMEKAEEFDLCERFDEAVAEWNNVGPAGTELPTRQTEFSVTIEITVTGKCGEDIDPDSLLHDAISSAESSIEYEFDGNECTDVCIDY